MTQFSGTNELEGQVAVVTGGGRGIGLAIAEALAEGGARVAVVDVDEKESQEAANGLPGDGHRGYKGDVTEGADLKAVLQRVEAELGPITVLVNNAGITRDNLILRMSEDEWDQVLSVNLKGAFNATKAVARGMMKRRTGAIINIASVIGLMGNAGQANYAASKAGLMGFTKSVAREFASRGVRCNSIASGFIQTASDSPGNSGRASRYCQGCSISRRAWGRIHYRPGDCSGRWDGHVIFHGARNDRTMNQ